jgi:hypothetical protein
MFWIKLISFILLSIYILWRRWAHNFAYIMGDGDSHGADGVVNDDVGAKTFDDDPVTIYLVTTMHEA